MNKPIFSECFFILAGGKGSRFKEYEKFVPKVFYPFEKDVPFVFYMIREIKKNFPCSKVFFLQYESYKKGEKDLQKYYEFYKILEKDRLGTGGAIKNAFDSLGVDNAVVINGDSFVNLDWKDFITYSLGKSFTLLAGKNSIEGKLNLKIKKPGKVIFSQNDKELVNQGVYFVNKTFINSMFEGIRSFSFEEALESKDLDYYKNDNLLFDIGSPLGAENFLKNFKSFVE